MKNKATTKIEELRDGQQMSWAKVAKELGLASPSAARKAYTQATGRSHSTSVLAGKPGRTAGEGSETKERKPRKAKGAKVAGVTKRQAATASATETAPTAPVFSADIPDAEIVSTIQNHTVVVSYTIPGVTRRIVDEHFVRKVDSFGVSPRSGARWVRFNDKDQKSRTVSLDSIVGVR